MNIVHQNIIIQITFTLQSKTYNLLYRQHCEVCDSEGVDRRVQMIYICLVSNLPANKSSAARAAPSPDPASTSSRPNRTSETTYWVRFALT